MKSSTLAIAVACCASLSCTSATSHGDGSGGQAPGIGGSNSGVGGGGITGTGGAGTGTGGRTGTGGGGPGAGGTISGSGGATSAWSCPPGPFPTTFIPVGATPTRVTGLPPTDTFNNNGNDFGNIEGPVWLGDSLYVSEIANGNGNIPPARVLKVTAAGVVSIAIPDSGSNGLAVDATGNLLSANHKVGGIVRFTLPAGTPTTVVASYNSARFDSPNDLALARDGTIFFSDPDHQAGNPRPQTQTRVYRVAAGSNVATPITDYVNEPNGITLSLDEKTLFVSGGSGVFKYPVNTNGTVGAGVQIVSAAVDGMAMDCAGHLYGAVINQTYVIAIDSGATGIAAELGRINVAGGIQGVTNVAFGGADHLTLYITGLGNQKGLFQMQVAVPGMPY